MAAKEVNTQTDNEVHDVFYYKTRAYKAEVGIHVEQVSLSLWRVASIRGLIFSFCEN